VIRRATLAGLLAATAAPARAEAPPSTIPAKPDQSAIDAGEANLASIAVRKGLVFTFALGGAITLGFGRDDDVATVDNATGRGGAVTLRLAHVATPRTLVTVEVTGGTLFYSISAGDMKRTYRTEFQNFLVGGQFYVKPAIWIRGGLGFGRQNGEDLDLEGTPNARKRFRLPGPAGWVGVGIDLLRRKWFRMSAEVTSTASINREGVLSSSGFLIGFSVD
jgi:hypothetical protein